MPEVRRLVNFLRLAVRDERLREHIDHIIDTPLSMRISGDVVLLRHERRCCSSFILYWRDNFGLILRAGRRTLVITGSLRTGYVPESLEGLLEKEVVFYKRLVRLSTGFLTVDTRHPRLFDALIRELWRLDYTTVHSADAITLLFRALVAYIKLFKKLPPDLRASVRMFLTNPPKVPTTATLGDCISGIPRGPAYLVLLLERIEAGIEGLL